MTTFLLTLAFFIAAYAVFYVINTVPRIKAFFKKDLAAITSPLSTIYSNLETFITEAKSEISTNESKARALFSKNELLKVEHEAAALVKENLNKLLGHVDLVTTSTPLPVSKPE